MTMFRTALVRHGRSLAPRLVPRSSIAVSAVSPLAVVSTAQWFSEMPGVGALKTSTGYVGLAVEPDWYNGINKKFQGLLDRMEDSEMPASAQYRMDVTKWCQAVLAAAQANPTDPEAVEEAIGMGQVEELLEMADDEGIAMDAYLRTRMWEMVDAASIDFNPDPTADPFAAGGDPSVAEKLKKGMEGMKDT